MQFNGKPYNLAEPKPVRDILMEAGLELSRVAVMINGEIVPRDKIDQVMVNYDDELEAVSFVGGG